MYVKVRDKISARANASAMVRANASTIGRVSASAIASVSASAIARVSARVRVRGQTSSSPNTINFVVTHPVNTFAD